MANQIERDVYVTTNADMKNPIDYVAGTNMIPIAFTIRDYNVPNGATAQVWVEKPSGSVVYDSASVSGNQVTVQVTTQMFAEPGINAMQIQIVKGETELVSFIYPVFAHKNLTEGDSVKSENESPFYTQMVQATQEAKEAADAANDALEAIHEAVEGTIINDSQPSETTVYSSRKAEEVLSDASDVIETTIGYACKNLIPYPYDETTITRYGITFTDNGDGTITADGTCTATGATYAYINLHMRSDTKTPFTLKKGKYILSGAPADGGPEKWQISLGYTNPDDGTSYVNVGIDYGSGLSFELDEDVHTLQIQVVVRPGVTMNDAIFYPMIRYASIEDGEWEPYDKPINDRLDSVAEMAQPNLLTDEYLRSHLDCTVGTEFTYFDGELEVALKTPGANAAAYVELTLEPDTVYSVSYKSNRDGNTGGGVSAQGRDSSGIVTLESKFGDPNAPVVFNTGNYTTIRIAFWIGGVSVTGNLDAGYSARFWDIMLVKGSSASPYINGGKDLAVAFAEVNERSAINLFDSTGFTAIRATQQASGNGVKVTATDQVISGDAYVYKRIVLEPNTWYTISAKSTRTGQSGGGIAIYNVKDGQAAGNIVPGWHSLVNPIAVFCTGVASEFDTIQFNFTASVGTGMRQEGDSATFTDIMLAKGRFASLRYVPYIGNYNSLAEAISDLKSQILSMQNTMIEQL